MKNCETQIISWIPRIAEEKSSFQWHWLFRKLFVSLTANVHVFPKYEMNAFLLFNYRLECTYSVCMLFIESNVPFASDWILLSYNDNKFRLVKSLNESLRMHEISFAFNSSNCKDVNPRNTFVGRFFILLPYKTLWKKMQYVFVLVRINVAMEKLLLKSETWEEVLKNTKLIFVTKNVISICKCINSVDFEYSF